MTAPSFRYDFSLWYCLEDDAIATSICTTLREHGFRGYVEHQDHVAGAPVVATAGEIIEVSRVAILLLSARSVSDPWCQRVAEWNILQTIHREETKVIPVYVDIPPREVPVALRHLTGLEYNRPFFQQRLLKSLQSITHRAQIPRPPSRRRF